VWWHEWHSERPCWTLWLLRWTSKCEQQAFNGHKTVCVICATSLDLYVVSGVLGEWLDGTGCFASGIFLNPCLLSMHGQLFVSTAILVCNVPVRRPQSGCHSEPSLCLHVMQAASDVLGELEDVKEALQAKTAAKAAAEAQLREAQAAVAALQAEAQASEEKLRGAEALEKKLRAFERKGKAAAAKARIRLSICLTGARSCMDPAQSRHRVSLLPATRPASTVPCRRAGPAQQRSGFFPFFKSGCTVRVQATEFQAEVKRLEAEALESAAAFDAERRRMAEQLEEAQSRGAAGDRRNAAADLESLQADVRSLTARLAAAEAERQSLANAQRDALADADSLRAQLAAATASAEEWQAAASDAESLRARLAAAAADQKPAPAAVAVVGGTKADLESLHLRDEADAEAAGGEPATRDLEVKVRRATQARRGAGTAAGQGPRASRGGMRWCFGSV
jgi:hypothetical protein